MSIATIITFLFSNLMAIITAFLIQILVREYNIFQIIFLNAGLFLLFSVPYNKIKNKNISYNKRDIVINCITGTLFFISMSCWYVGLMESSLVEATTLKFLTPISIMFFSCILTNKQLKHQDWIIIVFSVVSSCLLCFYGNLNKLGLFSILMSVTFSTIFHVSSRMFRTDNVLFRSIMIRLMSLVVSFIMCCYHHTELAVMSINHIILFALLFITSNIYLLLSNKLNMCKDIEYLQPLNLIRIIFAIIIEYCLMNTISGVYWILGIFILILITLTILCDRIYRIKH